jgi:hypothetical protein
MLFNHWFQIWQQKLYGVCDFWETCKWSVKFLWIQSVLGTFAYSREKRLLSSSFPSVCSFVLPSVCLSTCIGTVPTGQISVTLLLKTSTKVCQENPYLVKIRQKRPKYFFTLLVIPYILLSYLSKHFQQYAPYTWNSKVLIFQHVSVVATTITREFTLQSKTPMLKLFVLLRTHNKIHITSFIT